MKKLLLMTGVLALLALAGYGQDNITQSGQNTAPTVPPTTVEVPRTAAEPTGTLSASDRAATHITQVTAAPVTATPAPALTAAPPTATAILDAQTATPIAQHTASPGTATVEAGEVAPTLSAVPGATTTPTAEPGATTTPTAEPAPGSPTQTPAATATAGPPGELPNGQIAYVDQGRLMLLDVASGRLTQLPGDKVDPRQIDWSPNWEWLAYAASVDGNLEIFIVNADGTSAHQVTDDPRVDAVPAYGPDGTLYFVREVVPAVRHEHGAVVELHRITKLGDALPVTTLQACATPSRLSVRLDGLLAISYPCSMVPRVLFVDLEEHPIALPEPSSLLWKRMEHGECKLNILSSATWAGTWSNSGRQLAFIGEEDECVEPGLQHDVPKGMMFLGAGTPPALEHQPFPAGSAWGSSHLDWSPDDRLLVYGRQRWEPDPGRPVDDGLWLVSRAEGWSVRLTTSGTTPAWRPGPVVP